MRRVEINEEAYVCSVITYNSNIMKTHILKDGDTATPSVRSLLYTFSLKKECYKLKWNEYYKHKKPSCAHSWASFILPCTARQVTNLEICVFAMLFPGQSFLETFYSEVYYFIVKWNRRISFSRSPIACTDTHYFYNFFVLSCWSLGIFNSSEKQSSLNVYKWLPSW